MATFFDNTRIDHWQSVERSKMRTAFENARKRHKLTPLDRHCIKPQSPDPLLAVNNHSRTNWGRFVSRELAQFLCGGGDGSEHNQEILFVTLCDRHCVKSLSGPTEVELAEVKERLRYALRGLNYFGVVEPALYVNWKMGHHRRTAKQCISWHLHAVVWGISKKKMQKRLRASKKRGRYQELERGLKPTSVKPVKPGRLPKAVAYMMKSPTFAYRVSAIDCIVNGKNVADDAGEIQRRFKQSKAPLRHGERLTLYLAMRHLYLDDLALAGGEGRVMLATAKRLARPRRPQSFGFPNRHRSPPGGRHLGKAPQKRLA
jgi:hypothetical protein